MGGLVAAILGAAATGLGVLMARTFDGISPMADRETLGPITRVVDGYVSCFIVEDGQAGLFLVDTCNSAEAEPLVDALTQRGRAPTDVRAVLFTHGHADHTAGVDRFDRATVHAHRDERRLLGGEVAARGPLPRLSGRGPRIEVDRPLEDGDTFTIGRREIRVFHLPGHTEGSVAYLIDDLLLLGDNGHGLADGRMVSAPWVFSDDTARNRASLRALAARLRRERIEPRLLVFSHSGVLEPMALARWAAENPQ